MKLLDEKGRLFGKLNILDLLVIVIVIAAAAVLVAKFTGNSALSGTTTKLTYTVKVCNVDKEVYDSIQQYIPGQLMASGEMLDGYVVSADATPSKATEYVIDASSNGVTLAPAEDTYDVVFTIEANVQDSLTNEVGTQEVRVGKTHIVKTAQFELDSGVILTCDWEKQAEG